MLDPPTRHVATHMQSERQFKPAIDQRACSGRENMQERADLEASRQATELEKLKLDLKQ